MHNDSKLLLKIEMKVQQISLKSKSVPCCGENKHDFTVGKYTQNHIFNLSA